MRRAGWTGLLAVAACCAAGCSASVAGRPQSAGPLAASSASAPVTASAPPSTTPTTAASRPAPHSGTHAASAPRPAAASSGQRLPLDLPVGDATEVITVVADSASATTATLRAWRKSGPGWAPFGPAVFAHLGADGLSSRPSESRSATPIGSFTLTQAFGSAADPGSALPYRQTTPADWWISQPGPLYNTEQHCSAGCPFTEGPPNEHLYYEQPFYRYAVVIDYNTRNSPTGVRPGAGSAFFLHVTDGSATAGCVAIPQSELVSIMRWLNPADHPRILIGVA